jgi:hypothetical protein
MYSFYTKSTVQDHPEAIDHLMKMFEPIYIYSLCINFIPSTQHKASIIVGCPIWRCPSILMYSLMWEYWPYDDEIFRCGKMYCSQLHYHY